MLDKLINFIVNLPYEDILLGLSLFGNFIFVGFKLKGSTFEKHYKKALKNIAAEKYYCKVKNKYYKLEDIQFVSTDSISEEEYNLNKGGN